MAAFKNSKQKKIVIWSLSLFLALLIPFLACGIYLADYYPADTEAVEAFLAEKDVSVTTLDGGSMVIEPREEPVAGLIFYPGGKVDHKAYLPLMTAFAEKGILCILVKMPFRLAVFDMDAAERFEDLYPQVDRWFIGGHSLGGAMAASYLEKHADGYEGLLLLGAYSSNDLSDKDLRVLSIYGSEDRVLDREKYQSCYKNLPKDTTERVIEGGCHAYFGNYGRQDGDGEPTVAREVQLLYTANAFLEFLKDGQ